MKRFRYIFLVGIFLMQSCTVAATQHLPTEHPGPVSTKPVAVEESPTPVPTAPAPARPDPITSVPTMQPPDPIQTPTFGSPAGYTEYRDPVSHVSIFLPESWLVTDVIEGQRAMFQSYPLGKYVGGEMFEPGDTKCDLTIHSPGASAADLVQQRKSDPLTTVISEREIVLQSGEKAIRMELNTMGPALSLFSEIQESTVVFTCFGDFTHFDEISGTLAAVK